MEKMYSLDFTQIRKDYEYFREATEQFCRSEMDTRAYKAISGGFGSYAQRGGQKHMLRLRFPGGRITKAQLGFIVQAIEKYNIRRLHLTTCQTIQLHDLDGDIVCPLAVEALDYHIVCRGAGGDYPRNVMAPPLSGAEPGEYFDVLPYAMAASRFLLEKLDGPKLPRKLKVGFSSSPENLTHATFRDLGFAARADRRFDVYSAGGLGNGPKLGVLVAEAVAPGDILYYIQAMYDTFLAYGNYENRARARSRFMQDTLGGPEAYRAAFRQMLEKVLKSGRSLKLSIAPPEVRKEGNGTAPVNCRIISQKQPGLYAVACHPVGGCPDPELFVRLYDATLPMEAVELRLAPDQSFYIINCNASEAARLLELTKHCARTAFSSSVACIGSGICQHGLRDSQAMLKALVQMEQEMNFDDGTLPKIYISGCPSSCGTHQSALIGLRGAVKNVGNERKSAYQIFIGGSALQGQECFGKPSGILTKEQVAGFFRELGKMVQESGLSFEQWHQTHPAALETLVSQWSK